jgi:hypothetical protein
MSVYEVERRLGIWFETKEETKHVIETSANYSLVIALFARKSATSCVCTGGCTAKGGDAEITGAGALVGSRKMNGNRLPGDKNYVLPSQPGLGL